MSSRCSQSVEAAADNSKGELLLPSILLKEHACNVQAAADNNKGLEDMLISGLESFPISSCNAWGLPSLSNRLSLGRYLAILVIILSCLALADMAGIVGQACM